MNGDHRALWDLIRPIRFAMLTTRSADGGLRSRPMTTQNQSLDDGDPLYFFASRQSGLAEQVAEEPAVNVAYADTDHDRYVSISGRARVVDDRSRVEALWSVAAKAWFPDGPGDPDLQLLQVDIEQAEYWDVRESKLTQLIKMTAAAASGHKPDLGEHRQVR